MGTQSHGSKIHMNDDSRVAESSRCDIISFLSNLHEFCPQVLQIPQYLICNMSTCNNVIKGIFLIISYYRDVIKKEFVKDGNRSKPEVR